MVPFLSDLVKYSMARSIAWSFCHSWACCNYWCVLFVVYIVSGTGIKNSHCLLVV